MSSREKVRQIKLLSSKVLKEPGYSGTPLYSQSKTQAEPHEFKFNLVCIVIPYPKNK